MLIYVISDSVGETGYKLIKAATSQFPIIKQEYKRKSFVRDEMAIDECFESYQRDLATLGHTKGLFVFTLVSPELRSYTLKKGEELDIPTMDILGPYVDELAKILKLDPRLKPGLTHQIDTQYRQRVEAIEFAIKYDDGKDASGLKDADVVLIGISRTSKTPLCMYLANQGLKACNVPLVPDTPVPKELFLIPRNKVIALTIDPEILISIRQNRLKEMGVLGETSYTNCEKVFAELDFADKIARKVGCPIINVSNKAVEETASKILNYIQRSV